MNDKTIRVVFAAIDTQKLTLYKEDGETIIIPQGDPRLPHALERAKVLDFEAYVDITFEEIKTENVYDNFEKKSTGVVKFFRLAKAKLAEFFNPTVEIENETFGTPPTQQVADALEEISQRVNVQTEKAVADILAHAQPVSHANFNDSDLDKQGNVVESGGHTQNGSSESNSPDTVVAVVDGKIIPGVEKIKTQIQRAAAMGSTEGVERLMKRLASVIEKRRHSVEDVIRFMERGDLPVADDGSILVYKLLYRQGKKNGRETYVDCHSKNVQQWVGAHVCMDESLVDPNRGQDCSNGLHIARRGYLSGFSGDVCVLAKLAPEDVIAVPHGDANKVRACGYHIIAELTPAQMSKVKNNKPITDDKDGQELLARAMRGDHIGKTHEVRIHGQKGTNVVVKELIIEKKVPVFAPTVLPEALEESTKPKAEVALVNPDEIAKVAAIDPKEVLKEQTAALSRKEQAALLYNAWNTATVADKAERLAVLLKFKKEAKVSWEKLGLTDPTDATAKPVKGNPATVANKEFIKVVKDVKANPVASDASYKARIAKLLSIGKLDRARAQQVFDLKKQSKKSWEVLGVAQHDVGEILLLLNK